MKQAIRVLFALLILVASQHCVAERIHLHEDKPADHHHHSNHGLPGSHSGESVPHSLPDDSTCFHQVAPSVSKDDQQDQDITGTAISSVYAIVALQISSVMGVWSSAESTVVAGPFFVHPTYRKFSLSVSAANSPPIYLT